MFDSPVGRCEVVRKMVLLDQTEVECACEHGCAPDQVCPQHGKFSRVSGLSEETLETAAPPLREA